mmetsp:Transcript_7199/g.13940  ORF Transcript_7199/g.13940 Transcript_7199/m.13940 type:complete len:81 (+) Transcript_7199:621-863(+)
MLLSDQAPTQVVGREKSDQLIHWFDELESVSKSPEKWAYGWLKKEQMEDFDVGYEKHAREGGKAPKGFDKALQAANKLSK